MLLISGFSILLTVASLKLLFVPMGWLGMELNGDVVDEVDAGSGAGIAGVRIGDRLAPDTSFFVRQALVYSNHFGREEYSFDVVRDGRRKHITAVASEPDPNLGPVGYGAFPLFAASVFAFLISAVVATIVLLSRPSRLTWSFYLFCLGAMLPWFGSLVMPQTVPMPFGFFIQMVRVTLVCVGLFAGLDFALRFPTGEVIGWRKAVALTLPFFGIAYTVWWYLQWCTSGTPFLNVDPYDWVDVIVKCVIAVLSVIAVAATYLSSEPTQRQRMKWAVVGISLGYAAIAGQELLLRFGLFHGVLQFVTWCLVLAAFLAPLSVAYAIARHRVIDVRFVVTRGLAYLVISLVLAAAMAATYWGTNLFVQRVHVAALVQFSLAILLGVILIRTYSMMESGITRFFFRHHYEALRRLASLSGGLDRAESLEELERLVVAEPTIALDLVAGGVYRQAPNGWFVQMSTECPALPARLQADDPLLARMRAYAEALRLSSQMLEQIGSKLRNQSLALAMPLYVDGVLSSAFFYGAHSNGSDLDPQEVNAIVALQRPAELALRALLRRTERLRTLAELIKNSPPNAGTDPYEYLSDQLIDSLPPRTLAAVAACAAIPNASAGDIDSATEEPDSSRRIAECSPLSAILQVREEKTFALHPLVSRAIERRFPEECRSMLARCGNASAEIGAHARAAQLLQLAGLRAAAASEWEAHLSRQDPQRLLGPIGNAEHSYDADRYAYDGAASDSYPNSWIAYSASRLYRESPRALLATGRKVASSAPEGAAPLLAPWLTYLEAEAGDLHVADGAFRSHPTAIGPSFVQEFASVTRALVAGRLGSVSQCAREVADNATSVLCGALFAVIRAAHIERMHADWNNERSLLDSAIEALRAENSRFVAWALAEAAEGAWLAGDERARAAYSEALREAVLQHDAEAFAHIVETTPSEKVRAESPPPRWLASAHLRAACSAKTWGESRDCARLALTEANNSHEPFLIVLAHLAVAEFDESVRQEQLRHALHECRKIDSPALISAVRAITSGEGQAGMLQSFVANLRRDRELDEAALVVEAVAGRVRRGRLVVALSERELAVVLAIARSQNATAGAELADLIWPDLEESAGAHAVQTCMHRLRQRLGDRGAIEKTAHGYRLRDGVLVDLAEIELFMRGVQGADTLDEFTALRLAALAKQLDASRPSFMALWEWFAPTERRIEEWRRFARYKLACDALARNDFDAAVLLAQSIVLNDELDEPAWELAIQALVAKGDPTGAKRELRRYREVTLRELKAEPSPHLYILVESASEAKPRLRVIGN